MKRTLTVLGRPRPQGSMRTLVPKRGSQPITIPSDQGIYKYRADIQTTWMRVFGDPKPLEGAITLHAAFIFRRPDSHYLQPAPTKKRGKREVLKGPHEDVHYISTPDVDKLARAVGDALTGFAYYDDKQVSSLWVDKRWGDADMTIIDILQPGDDEEEAISGTL